MFKRTGQWITGLGGAIAAASLAFAPAAGAAGEAYKPEHHHWHHAGVFGKFDQAQLQRGWQVYREVCASCHGMQYISFRHLGQEGGPFYDEEHPVPTDNPVVRAIAAEWIVQDGPDDVGDMFERPGLPTDRILWPYANEQAARASNGGALPPDLSVITKARHYGADYVRSLLLGYREAPAGEAPRAGLYYNPWFSGGQIAMAPQLIEGRLDYAEGQPLATPEQMAEDVSAFLTWAAEPQQIQRKQMGFQVVIYLGLLSVLLWLAYKQVWRDVDH